MIDNSAQEATPPPPAMEDDWGDGPLVMEDEMDEDEEGCEMGSRLPSPTIVIRRGRCKPPSLQQHKVSSLITDYFVPRSKERMTTKHAPVEDESTREETGEVWDRNLNMLMLL